MKRSVSAPSEASALDRFILVPLERLETAPWNFKVEDAQQAQKLVASLRHGQFQNLVVRELHGKGAGTFKVVGRRATGTGTYETVDGNHKLIAYRTLAEEQPVEGVVCYNLGAVSVPEAIRIAHQLTQFFNVDAIAQAKAIKTLQTEIPLADLAEISPFTLERLTEISGLLEQLAPTEPKPRSDTHPMITFVFGHRPAYEEVLAWLTACADQIGEPHNRNGFAHVLSHLAEQGVRIEQ